MIKNYLIKNKRFLLLLIAIILFNIIRSFYNDSKGLNVDYTLKYIPKGYKLVNSIIETRQFGSSISHDYNDKNGNIITLSIDIYDNTNWGAEIETNGIINTLKYNGKTYSEAENYEYNQIIWNEGSAIMVLYGKVSKEVLRDIIYNNM